MPKLNPETKAALRQRLTELLGAHGRSFDYSHIRAEFPEIGKASFYKILRQVEASGAPAAKAKAKIERAVNREVEAVGYTALLEMGLQDYAFEAVVVRHPDLFSPEAIQHAKGRVNERKRS